MDNALGKYFLAAAALYALINYVPRAKLPVNDTIMIIVGVVGLYILLNCGEVREGFDVGAIFAPAVTAPAAEPVSVPTVEPVVEPVATPISEPVVKPAVVPKSDCGCDAKVAAAVEKALVERKIDGPKNVDSNGLVQPVDVNSDWRFSQLNASQYQAMGTPGGGLTDQWDSAFTIIPTDRWAPPRAQAVPCKQEKVCPVCPVATTGYPVNLMEFDASRKVLPPDNINIEYIKKLNSGEA